MQEVPQRPCDVAVIFALPIEAGPFLDRLPGRLTIQGARLALQQGELAGRNVVVATSGAGSQAAAAATEIVILGHRPQWVITAGFAGGLIPGLRNGDFLLPDRIVNLAGAGLAIDCKIAPETLAETAGLHVGTLLTADRIIRLPVTKRKLAADHQAAAVDLESFAVADVCRSKKTRCLGVRIISDTVEDELPADMEHLMSQTTLMGKLGALTGTLVRRPSRAKDLWKLRQVATTCAERLGQFVAEMIVQLVPGGPAAQSL